MTPGYAHATGAASDESRQTLGAWIPTDPGKCLQPEHVANIVVKAVEMMNQADIQEISVDAPVHSAL